MVTGTVDNLERFFESFGWSDFEFDGGFIPGVDWVNKPFVQVVVSALLILVFWLLASRKLQRPVKWVATRTEAMLTDNHGRDQLISGQKTKRAIRA